MLSFPTGYILVEDSPEKPSGQPPSLRDSSSGRDLSRLNWEETNGEREETGAAGAAEEGRVFQTAKDIRSSNNGKEIVNNPAR